jgi:hypothetical protein
MQARKRKEIDQHAHPKVIEGYVHNPYGNGTNVVYKIWDPLVAMQKKGQITADQYEAAQRLQFAYETVYGQAGGAMDFDRARGGGSPGAGPAQFYMVASETLRLAKTWLYPRDHAVVYRICIQGMKVADCANLFGEGKEAKLEAGRALKRGLSELARRWGYSSAIAKSKASFYREEEPVVQDIPVVRGNTFIMS